ncbi:transmembrane protein 116 [Puntigrus tetrazona]|uniref:transmembrane protein 116 n=1 Tax=Puntigrus tetrazona TaxID=1606681 RepID=UPI001C890C52|nr:transmembrane protein 116 [Puntigrus tetrazona]XP_043120136.1 transmembrane protein 116 [Puntigrus tetrazona]
MNSSGLTGEDEVTILSSIYVSALGLSLIGSCSVVVVSIIKRRHLNEQAKPLLQLALADFLASLVLMITAIINLPREVLSVSAKVCMYGLPLSLAFYSISFLLVIIYACESAHAFQGWREEPMQETFETQLTQLSHRRRRFCLIYVIAWLVPIIGYYIYIRTVHYMEATITQGEMPTLTTVSRGSSARFCNSCILFLHLTNDSCVTVDTVHALFIRIFTLCSVLIVITVCTVVYCKIEGSYRRYENTCMITMTQRNQGGIWSSARYMILVIIFCWAPALLLICLSFPQPRIKPLFPLFVLQALSVSLQGFLNSIVYAWRRRNFREAVLGERLPLMAYSSRAFFDQSLSEPSS